MEITKIGGMSFGDSYKTKVYEIDGEIVAASTLSKAIKKRFRGIDLDDPNLLDDLFAENCAREDREREQYDQDC